MQSREGGGGDGWTDTVDADAVRGGERCCETSYEAEDSRLGGLDTWVSVRGHHEWLTYIVERRIGRTQDPGCRRYQCQRLVFPGGVALSEIDGGNVRETEAAAQVHVDDLGGRFLPCPLAVTPGSRSLTLRLRLPYLCEGL